MKFSYYLAKALKKLLNPPALKNCSIDQTARVCSRSELSRVTIGRYSYVGSMCFLVNVKIGAFCSIADRCCIGGATHPIQRVSTSPVFHKGRNILGRNFTEFPAIKTTQTIIEDDVWLGMGCFVKSGVRIGCGAVVGMGSVITHDVPPYEIWAGNPARKIRARFDQEVANALKEIPWAQWDDQTLAERANAFGDVEAFIEEFREQ